ncbi:MAG: hypothetical protein WBA63_16665 [Thermomicrobiales bacterium]
MNKVIRGIAIIAAVSFAARLFHATRATTTARSRSACGAFPAGSGHVTDIRRFTRRGSTLV